MANFYLFCLMYAVLDETLEKLEVTYTFIFSEGRVILSFSELSTFSYILLSIWIQDPAFHLHVIKKQVPCGIFI
jgi:hypothetical protein